MKIPDEGLLVNTTTLNSDLKGVPTVEQFNPPSISYTAKTMRPLALSAHQPPSIITSQIDRRGKIDYSGIGTLMEGTILDRHLTGDPIVG